MTPTQQVIEHIREQLDLISANAIVLEKRCQSREREIIRLEAEIEALENRLQGELERRC